MLEAVIFLFMAHPGLVAIVQGMDGGESNSLARGVQQRSLKNNLIIRQMLRNGGGGAAALSPTRFRSVANCT